MPHYAILIFLTRLSVEQVDGVGAEGLHLRLGQDELLQERRHLQGHGNTQGLGSLTIICQQVVSSDHLMVYASDEEGGELLDSVLTLSAFS